MRSDEIIVMILTYVICAALSAGPVYVEFVSDLAPEGTGPAIAFIFAVLWPLVLVGAASYGVFVLTVTVSRSFVVLFRHIIKRSNLPRAKVHKTRD